MVYELFIFDLLPFSKDIFPRIIMANLTTLALYCEAKCLQHNARYRCNVERLWPLVSVTSRKSQNVYKSCPKMISLEK